MKNTSPSHPVADTPPTGSPADRVAALDLLLGEAEVERIALDIRMLRRLSELALREAERLDRAAEARAARLDTAEARLAAAPVAERVTDTDEDADTGTDEDADSDVDGDVDADAVESLQPTGETSLALHRLTRMVRLNIMLEQKLIADFRAPKTEAAPKPRDKAPEPSRWAQFGQGSELAERKQAARQFTEDSACTDERLDREAVEALLEELDNELASGKLDKDLLKRSGVKVASDFLTNRGLKPNHGPRFARARAEMVASSIGQPIDATAEPGPAELNGSEADVAPEIWPQPADPGGAAELPDAPSGAGPPKDSG